MQMASLPVFIKMEGDAFLHNQNNSQYQSLIEQVFISNRDLANWFLTQVPTVDDFRNLDDQSKQRLRDHDPQISLVLSAIDLGRLIVKSPRQLCGKAYSSDMIGHAMIDAYAGDNQESVMVICTDPHNDIVAQQKMFMGGSIECRLYLDRIFRFALLHNACGLILVHNHPTGDVTPSECDEQFQKRAQRAGKLIGIHLLDFLIVGAGHYFSWSEGMAAMNSLKSV